VAAQAIITFQPSDRVTYNVCRGSELAQTAEIAAFRWCIIFRNKL